MDEQHAESQPAPAPPAAPAAAGKARPAAAEGTERRPHWITVAIGLVSPLLAGVALIISLESLHTSEMSLEVGQRAYVSLQNGSITFSRMTIGPPPMPSSALPPPPGSEIQTEQGPIATMLLTVTVVNSGNTPADFTQFTPTFQHLPVGWTVRKQEWQPLMKTPPYLGAKSQTEWEYRQSFTLTPQAWASYAGRGPLSALYFSGELQYVDVFHKKHPVSWCWTTLADEHNLGRVEDCGKLTFEKSQQ